MARLLELVGERRADALRRRVGRDERRVGGLERLQLVVEDVVRRVLHDRLVVDVVGDRRLVQQLAQLARARSEELKQILRGVGDRVGLLSLERARDRGCAPT